MRILDLTAGNRAIWFDRENPLATFIDKRAEVSPTVVADSCELPAEIGTDYDLIVFDPPHKNNGAQFGMARSYGRSTLDEIRDLLRDGAKEAHRVSKPNALMAFKWNDHNIPLVKAVALMRPFWEPLFGHGLRPQQRRGETQTYWAMLRRADVP